MAKIERTRLADRHELEWYLLDGMTIMEWRRIPDRAIRQAKLLRVLLVDHPMTDFDPTHESFRKNNVSGGGHEPLPDPTFPTGQWWLNGVAVRAKTFNTSTKNLKQGEYALHQGMINWIDEEGVEHDVKLSEVTIVRDGSNQVETINYTIPRIR